MNELKTRTMEVINQINQDWIEELQKAEKENRGIDLTPMMGKFSQNILKLDQYFREGADRNKKKKGWF